MSKRYRILDDYSGRLEIIDDNTKKKTRNIKECCEWLNKQNEKIEQIQETLQKHYNTSKEDYNKAVKAGMPSSLSYSEMELITEIAKEIGVKLQ